MLSVEKEFLFFSTTVTTETSIWGHLFLENFDFFNFIISAALRARNYTCKNAKTPRAAGDEPTAWGLSLFLQARCMGFEISKAA
jgi:hypothetical protein